MKPRKMLVVTLGRIGDLIMTTPMLRALKRADPGLELHFLAGRNNYEVLTHHPYLDRVHVHTKLPAATISLLARLRRERFDVWIDPKDHASSESRWFARLSNAPVKIGFNRCGEQVFTHSIKADLEQVGMHATSRALGVLEPLGIEATDKRPILAVSPEAEADLDRFLAARSIERYVFVNISGTHAARHWPVERWLEFLNAIHEPDRPCLLCGMPGDCAQLEQILARIRSGERYPARTIVDVLSAVKRAEMVITVDTAIVHIASAFDTPLLGLYANCHREYTKYLPLSAHSRCVRALHPEAPVAEIPVTLALDAYRSLEAELSGA